jgi:two-component system sensor histidine kinase BaeS
VSLKIKLIILFLVASFIPFATVGLLLYLDNPKILGELFYFGGLLIIFVVFLGLSLSQIVIDPIENLIRATRAVKGKNLSARVPVTSTDEIGELARAFNQMMNELEQTDKAKTEFISLASHHLRTPLSTVSWHLEMLMTDSKLSGKEADYLKQAYGANQRMVELVNALLEASHLELGTLVIKQDQVNILELIKGVLEDLEPKMQQKSIRVITEFKLKKKILELDQRIFRIILQNLLDNALKYTQDKGHVSLKIDTQDGNILISVIDSGYGIPIAEQSQIFNKLYRASNAKLKVPDGLGLGLYTVKAMVERIKGEIWFESQEHEGTTFYVKLPTYGGRQSRRKRQRQRQENG